MQTSSLLVFLVCALRLAAASFDDVSESSLGTEIKLKGVLAEANFADQQPFSHSGLHFAFRSARVIEIEGEGHALGLWDVSRIASVSGDDSSSQYDELFSNDQSVFCVMIISASTKAEAKLYSSSSSNPILRFLLSSPSSGTISRPTALAPIGSDRSVNFGLGSLLTGLANGLKGLFAALQARFSQPPALTSRVLFFCFGALVAVLLLVRVRQTFRCAEGFEARPYAPDIWNIYEGTGRTAPLVATIRSQAPSWWPDFFPSIWTLDEAPP